MKNPIRSVPREFRPIIREAIKHRWRVRTTPGGHLCLKGPNGELVFASKTPSNWRARHCLIRDLKRAGADWL